MAKEIEGYAGLEGRREGRVDVHGEMVIIAAAGIGTVCGRWGQFTRNAA